MHIRKWWPCLGKPTTFRFRVPRWSALHCMQRWSQNHVSVYCSRVTGLIWERWVLWCFPYTYLFTLWRHVHNTYKLQHTYSVHFSVHYDRERDERTFAVRGPKWPSTIWPLVERKLDFRLCYISQRIPYSTLQKSWIWLLNKFCFSAFLLLLQWKAGFQILLAQQILLSASALTEKLDFRFLLGVCTFRPSNFQLIVKLILLSNSPILKSIPSNWGM